MKALIFNGKVVQIEDEEFPVASALQWIDIVGITPAPGVGWSYDGVSYTPPPGPSIADLKKAKRAEFNIEGVTRIAAQVPEWNSIDIVAYTVSISNLLNLGSMTAAQTLAKDIYLYVKNTVSTKLAAVTTKDALDAIDPTADDPFADGTPWPA